MRGLLEAQGKELGRVACIGALEAYRKQRREGEPAGHRPELRNERKKPAYHRADCHTFRKNQPFVPPGSCLL
jgi:hypothetical protein